MKEMQNKVKAFLKENRMHHEDIDMDSCCDTFIEEMNAGLEGQESSLAMIPTYIETGKEIPTRVPVTVLDAGGTNFRAATVCFDKTGKPIIENFVQKPMPGIDRRCTKDEFFGAIAACISGVADKSDSIGFCFSYPTEILPSKDGRLIRFCKEVKAEEVHGELIGANLLAALQNAGAKPKKRVVILNDTVATLLAGMSVSQAKAFDSCIGFILGPGSNCCYTESNPNITKTGDLDPHKEQIVNIESGSFAKAPRGPIDLRLDRSTLDPGKYTFEKMFSGGYLGPLVLKTLQEAARQGLLSTTLADKLLAAEDLRTKDINDFMRRPRGDSPLAAACTSCTDPDRPAVWFLLDALIERAAKLVAILLSSVVLKTGKGANPCTPVCITAEGTTFYELKSLKTKVECCLKNFLQEKHGRHVELTSVENATLIGAAIAGLTN